MSTARSKQPDPPADHLSPRQRALAEQQAAERRRERRLLGAIVIAVVVVLVGAGMGFQAWRGSRSPSAPTAATGSAAPTTAPVAIVAGQPIVWGSASAPVTIDLYADFHCPHCAEFEETYGSLLTEELAAGRIRLRNFPMAFIDAGSLAAANAFACASEAGFGEAYYAGLFANHTLEWSDAQLLKLAEQVAGSVPPGFGDCVAQRAHEAWVSSINDAAAAAGVTGTPTMFLGGDLVDIATLTPDELRAKITEAARK